MSYTLDPYPGGGGINVDALDYEQAISYDTLSYHTGKYVFYKMPGDFNGIAYAEMQCACSVSWAVNTNRARCRNAQSSPNYICGVITLYAYMHEPYQGNRT